MSPPASMTEALWRIGAAHYFTESTLATGESLGLDGVTFYFMGRGGVLGDVPPEVVTSAFGFFEPGLVTSVWGRGRLVVDPRRAGGLHLACAYDTGRAALPGVVAESLLARFAGAAASVVASADIAGLTLFAGYRAVTDIPEDPAGRAVHYGVCLRELRGSLHVLAVVASGLAPRVAHLIRRPEAYGIFGYPEPAPEVSATDLDRMATADVLTDRLIDGVFVGSDLGVLAEGAMAIEEGLRAVPWAPGYGAVRPAAARPPT